MTFVALKTLSSRENVLEGNTGDLIVICLASHKCSRSYQQLLHHLNSIDYWQSSSLFCGLKSYSYMSDNETST